MGLRVHSAIAERGRETVAWLAIGGTLVAMLVTAHQVRQGWAQRRVAAERAVREHLSSAAQLIGGEAARMSGLELRSLLWPALGTNGRASQAPLTIDAFARAGADQMVAMRDDGGAPRPGYFRFARGPRGDWSIGVRGALATDSAYSRAVLDTVRQWIGRVDMDRPGVRLGILHPTVQGVPLVIGMAPERGADGKTVALFGVVYSRSVALRVHVGHVLRGVPLLPAPTGERSDSAKAGNGKSPRATVAVRIRYAGGLRDVVSPAASDSALWRSAFVAERAIDGPDGGFTVEVAVPASIGRAYVDAAAPTDSERLTLIGVLLLGFGFAVAAALGLRRQYKLSEARRTFVAAVSHELRTPLAHVNALSETLLLGRAESPEQAQRWLRAIHREGQRLSVLTENVLLHARGERRGIGTAPEWTDVEAVVRDAVSLVEAQAQSRSASIVITRSDAAARLGGARGWVDAAALRQIVINFVENALKFGPAGQTVTVTIDVERVSEGDAPALLRLSVEDEGAGVPRGDRERIWQPFVRLSETANAPSGTGLGLSVVRQLVTELGGRCWVSDGASGGARFHIELPIAAPRAARAERPSAQPAPSSSAGY